MKYERQVVAFRKNNATLGVDDYLFIKETEDDSPLEIHSGFSRYVVTIIDTKTHLTPKANIPALDIKAIKKKVDAEFNADAVNLILQGMMTPTVEENVDTSSIGFTQKIFSLREFSGKTPCEILSANPEDKQKLSSHIQILKDNLEKYPKNQSVIDAINDAISLLDKGLLSKRTSTQINTTADVVIYKPADKYFKGKNDRLENGKQKCYSISIVKQPAMNYKWQISIENYFATIETMNDKTTQIKQATKEQSQRAVYRLNDTDFIKFIDSMYDNLMRFEHYAYVGQRKIMKANGFTPVQNNK